MKRREFIQASLTAAAAAGISKPASAQQRAAGGRVAIASGNGLEAVGKAMKLMVDGKDTLEAAVAGVNIVEDDPKDRTVGYGGLPNEDGVVQLDASVMHGPTKGAGAVASIEGIRNPSNVAKLVMERTDHVLLVSKGALAFALAMGFEHEELLTHESREIWMKWKRDLSDRDDWIDPEERLPASMPSDQRASAAHVMRHHGTINLNAVNEKGEISGVTTTSGLAFKIPGRVGDSPILGAGLYVDNEVGACGSTGRGEANLKTCASFLAVEFMRNGDSPEEAGLKTLKRIADNTVEPYLLNEDGKPRFNVNFYLVNKRKEFAGVAMWSRSRYAVHDGEKASLRESAYLFKRPERRRD